MLRIPRWRLFPKYATLIILLVGGMLVVSSAIGLFFSWREVQSNLQALQAEKAQGAANRIEQYILEIEHQLGWTAFPRMDSAVDAVEQRRIDYLKLLRQAPAITELVWIGADGRERLRVSRLAMDGVGVGTDLSAEPAFKATRSGKKYFGPVQFRKGTEPYMSIARPAGGGDGGATVADVNLKFVWDVVSRIKVGQTGLAYAVDAGGTLIAHPDISLVLKKTDLSQLPQVAVALQHGEVATERGAHTLSGQPVLAAAASIPSLGWSVFVETPRAEAFAPLTATLWRIGWVLAAGLVISVVASFFLARTLVRPIRALQNGAARIEAGELDHHIGVKTGDELEALAGQFNQMGATLAASYAGLERKVDERTAALTETLEHQTATTEVLRVISSSPTNVQPVFNAIAERAKALCGARVSAVTQYDGQWVHLVAYHGVSEEIDAPMLAYFPVRLSNVAVSARAVNERAPVQIIDVQEDPDYGPKTQARRAGYRGTLAVPMFRDGQAIGSITVCRAEPGPFPAKQVELLQTFAAQAVIALENVRLFNDAQEKTQQLETANRHKSEFLANMSHELRTPLNAVIGFSEVLNEEMFGAVNAKQREYLNDIHSSGQHLLMLINDVLDLSKIEAGRMELDLSCFDLGLLLDHSATLVRERAQRHGLVLTLDVGEGLEEWVADARKVKQAVVNLLSNAVKFTPNGGTVTVRARRLSGAGGDEGRAGDWAEIAVIDTGVGIAEQDQALVFEEFRQATGNVLRKSEGTGLGLALVKRFVELHGGEVHLKSAPEQGSTFTVVLPQLEVQALQ
jgi:signal transduction histidine kinase